MGFVSFMVSLLFFRIHYSSVHFLSSSSTCAGVDYVEHPLRNDMPPEVSRRSGGNLHAQVSYWKNNMFDS
jgi:hypothetical protein